MNRKMLSKHVRGAAKGSGPDFHASHFFEECRRQSRLANEADPTDPELALFMGAALDDLLRLCDSEEHH